MQVKLLDASRFESIVLKCAVIFEDAEAGSAPAPAAAAAGVPDARPVEDGAAGYAAVLASAPAVLPPAPAQVVAPTAVAAPVVQVAPVAVAEAPTATATTASGAVHTRDEGKLTCVTV